MPRKSIEESNPTSGPKMVAGKMHVRPNSTKIGFMSLSAELRNIIYELCLTTSRTTLKPQPFRGPQFCIKGRQIEPGEAWTRFRNYRGDQKNFLSPNLLVTCKTIHDEASPVLYGSNNFDLTLWGDEIYSTASWTDIIGSSIKFLRKATISHCQNQRCFIAVLDGLMAASSLQKLVIQRDSMENFQVANTMAKKGLYRLVLHLVKRQKGTDLKAALEVIDLEPCGKSFASEVWSILREEFEAETGQCLKRVNGKQKVELKP